MSVQEVVELFLRLNGYDGLYHSDVCGCRIGDLAPCGEVWGECRAGYNNPEEAERRGSLFWIQAEPAGGNSNATEAQSALVPAQGA